DAPFTVSTADVSSTITCPKTIQKKAGGVVLLVHGTGSDAKKNWEGGPYLEQLPGLDPGFDVCYIDLPGHALGDAQDTAEYVARAVQILAPQSSTKKVAFIAHSQGNLNVQWALTFWPSIRSSVSSYAALAGDYKGTTIGAFLCDAQNLTTGGCLPATWQQKPNSNFLQTLGNAGGLSALVPSTSLRTQYDDVVQPESGPEEQTSSYLAGASNILLQDLCDAAHLADHFSMVVDSAAFEAAYQTVKLSQAIPKNQIDKRAC
ncbi:alpha/beta-hydrolase, partial [Testicularia cyperi]